MTLPGVKSLLAVLAATIRIDLGGFLNSHLWDASANMLIPTIGDAEKVRCLGEVAMTNTLEAVIRMSGGHSSLARASSSLEGEELACVVLEAGDWGVLTGSCDDGELCRTSVEAGGVEVGDVGAGAPTWAERFHQEIAQRLVGCRR
ncbi:hypothetical protein Nepgr_002320 [Nepenthes gracilis]|uniref:Uncharacterized protein n=1 Tax=Nepenthes gracilis TaxID=150966 RepID=A0AAD3P6M5_NEPGR|nr:hypothetical protein Nepgr_002320 [Nepenthes gracilis]